MSPRPSGQSQSYSQTSRSSPSTRSLEVAAEELAIIEQALSKFIGPMARMLIRKEMGRAGTFKDFVEAVAGNVDHPQQRKLFLQTLRHALPRR
jgi:phytoene/squalene synthetase